MTLEEYRNEILSLLEGATDCDDVEKIIRRSILVLRGKKLNDQVIQHYLKKLKSGLESFSKKDFDQIHWCNIRCAVSLLNMYYLKPK